MKSQTRRWFKLDAGYYNDDKVIRAGVLAEALYVRSIGWCRERMSDGLIRREQLSRLAVGFDGLAKVADLVDALIEPDASGRALWTPCADGWVVTAFLDWNPSAEAVAANSSVRRTAAISRWARSEGGPVAPTGARHDEPPDDSPPLPVAAEWDIAAVMAHYRAQKAKHGARHNDVEVERVLGRLHTSQAVADELGGQLTVEDACTIVSSWLEHRSPVRVTMLFAYAAQWDAPWWRVCLRGTAATGTGKAGGPAKASADQPQGARAPTQSLSAYAKKLREGV